VGGHDQLGNIEDGYDFVWRSLHQLPTLAGRKWESALCL